ncbi:LOB domain-containing protein 37-like, partial [Cornus florida]|uniref:LOB domain-containing protein 37-like n=1 Tax=Cornus florida TaxID=4283 RepID=UPI0028A00F86
VEEQREERAAATAALIDATPTHPIPQPLSTTVLHLSPQSLSTHYVCQEAVETVLRDGILRPILKLLGGNDGGLLSSESNDNTSFNVFKLQDLTPTSRSKAPKRRRSDDFSKLELFNLNLSLTTGFPAKLTEKTRLGTPSMNSEESGMTTACLDSNFVGDYFETSPVPFLRQFGLLLRFWGNSASKA